MEKTIEDKTAAAILQRPEELTIGEKTYKITPPSIATLILASEAVSHMPQELLDKDKIMEETLSIAKDCRALGEVAAILILGSKHVDEIVSRRQTKMKKYLGGLIRRKRTVVSFETKKEQLARELLEDLTPKEFHTMIAQALLKMQVGDFFGITTFLTEVNLLRPTKVET